MKKQQDGIMARILPHLTLVLALVLMVLFVLDRFNGNMAFLTSEITKWMLFVLGVLSVTTAALLIAHQWRDDAFNEQQRQAAIKREQHAARKRAWEAERHAASVSAWQPEKGTGAVPGTRATAVPMKPGGIAPSNGKPQAEDAPAEPAHP